MTHLPSGRAARKMTIDTLFHLAYQGPIEDSVNKEAFQPLKHNRNNTVREVGQDNDNHDVRERQ
jgi:hypothetical protein